MSRGARAAIPSERTASEYWPPWFAYVFAVVLTAAMLLTRMGMGVVFAERPLLILFQLPIILSAYIGRLGAGAGGHSSGGCLCGLLPYTADLLVPHRV